MWLPLAFIAGGLIGAWGPSEELRTLEKRASSEAAPAGKSRGFDAFARMVNIPDVARRRRPLRRTAADGVSAKAQATGGKPAATNAPPVRAPRPVNPEDLRARIDEAVELWRTRSELVRAKAVEALALDKEGEAGFDEALAQMNEGIRLSVQALAERLADAEELTPELAVRLMGDVSATMAETYDHIGEIAGADRRDEVSALHLPELIDPSVFEPLIDVQDRLEGLSPRRAR